VITIDGREVPVRDGQTVMEAAETAGIYIPHLCYDARVTPVGNCRVCLVNVNGRALPACITQVADGQQIVTQSEELTETRRALVRMLFVEGNHFCPSCEKSGSCKLQAVAYYLDIRDFGFRQLFPRRAVDASHPDVILDRDRCIACGLCARASEELDRKGVFELGGRGLETRLLVNSPSGSLADSSVSADDQAVDICPTGALLRKHDAFRVPIGRRRFDLGDGRWQGASMNRKLKLATVSLAGCFGCHMSLLDIDDRIVDLAAKLELVRSPLTDMRQRGRYDVCLIEGGLCNRENIDVLRDLRARSDVLIAAGACAIFGGIPALRNRFPLEECLDEAYLSGAGLADGQLPVDRELPRLLPRVLPIHELVTVDFSIPGCPPPPEAFWTVLSQLVAGQPLHLPAELVRYD